MSQHLEYVFLGGAGLFHYHTTGGHEPYFSMIDYAPWPHEHNYVNDPYGNKNGFSYQFSFEMKRITKNNLILGGGLEYESVQSKKGIYWILDQYNYFQPAMGSSSLSSRFATAYPFIGYRVMSHRFYLDVMGGAALAISVSAAHQEGIATIDSTGQVIKVDVQSRQAGGNDPFEVRALLQSEIGYKNLGIYLGYSWGFYKGDEVAVGGIPTHSFSRYLRAGIFYRLR